MMNCPRCKAEYFSDDAFCPDCGLNLKPVGNKCRSCGGMLQPDDVFCPNCGNRAESSIITKEKIEPEKISIPAKDSVTVIPRIEKRKTSEEKTASVPNQTKGEEIVLEHELLLYLSKTHEHNQLSPLAAPLYSSSGDSPVKKEIPFDTSWFEVITKPAKAFYFSRLSRSVKPCQEILLVKGHTSLRWTDEEDKISIFKEETSWKFIDHIYTTLSYFIGDYEPSMLILDKAQHKALNAIDNICDIQVSMGIEPAFARQSEVLSYLNTKGQIREQVNKLSDQGMIRLLGTDDPLILMEPLGREIVRVLGESENYFNILVLNEGKDNFYSFNLVARKSKLYMVTTSVTDGRLVVRALSKPQLRSLLNIAWMADISMVTIDIEKTEGGTLKPVVTKQALSEMPKTTATPATAGFCSKCGTASKKDTAFCIKCGDKL